MATSSAPTTTLPCIVFDYGGGEQQRAATLFSVSDGAHRACEIDELRDKRSWPTPHGWVLSWDPETTATFLWNPPRAPAPAPADRIALPPPASSLRALSGRPTDAAAGGCTVLLVEPGESTVLWYCHAGGGAAAWTRHEYDLDSYSMPMPDCDAAWFYYHHSSTHCGVIDFPPAAGPPEFSTAAMEMIWPRVPEGDFMVAADMYIVEIDGELYTVSVFYHGIDFSTVADVGVFRMDFARQEHVRVESIGDRAILAGSGSHFGGWCPATEFGLLPNSVYSVDKRLHVFDIQLGTEEMLEPCKHIAAPSRKPFWIIPSHR
ncbi:hypothetical protein SETIT_4G024200v2 [Setaria italica]|uniref:KIB1-4 beta-propeller domain-containing protein n=1 Tax=Setaria italica TaxID=4555 RepID=K3Y380_SETIT|nr:hypothetical protein SETIT_4G024200v2 [Setaria italica]